MSTILEPAESPSAPPQLRKSVYWFHEDANVELVSSDHVRFKVWDYHLKSASKVWRDILSMGAETSKEPAVLHLEEHSGIVKIILDVILLPIDHLKNIDLPWSWKDAVEVYHAAQKYMLERYQPLFHDRVVDAVGPGNFIEALVWACHNDEAAVVFKAVCAGGDVFDNAWQYGGKDIGCEPGGWSIAFIEAIGLKWYKKFVTIMSYSHGRRLDGLRRQWCRSESSESPLPYFGESLRMSDLS